MARELTAAEAEYQAEKLADYVRRGGDGVQWFASKGFGAEDAKAIRDTLDARQRQAGERDE